MKTFYQLNVNGRGLQENYTDLQDAVKAFHTTLDALSTGRAQGTVKLYSVPSTPIASAQISSAGGYTFDYNYIRLGENGKFLIHID